MALLLAASILALLGHTHASQSIVRHELSATGSIVNDIATTNVDEAEGTCEINDGAVWSYCSGLKTTRWGGLGLGRSWEYSASKVAETLANCKWAVKNEWSCKWSCKCHQDHIENIAQKEVEFATQKKELTCDRDFALALQDVAHDFGNKCEKAVTNNDAFGITDPDTCELAADRLSLEYAGMATNWYVPNATLYMTKNCSLVCVDARGDDVPHNTAPCTPNAEGDCELAGVVPNCAGTLKVFFNPTEPIPDTYETAVGQQICLRQLYPRGIKGQNHATAGACGSTADGGEDPAWEAILDYQACRDAFLCTVGMSGCEMPEFEDHGSVRVPNRPKGCYREPVGTNEHGQTQGCYNFNRIEPTEAAEGWAVCQKVGTVQSVAANARTPRA